MVDVTDIIAGLILILFGVISGFLIPFIRSKMSADMFDRVQQMVWIAVEAAEMIYDGPGRGDEKKAYVIQTLEEMGYSIDVNYLDNLIESCVLELKAQGMEVAE